MTDCPREAGHPTGSVRARTDGCRCPETVRVYDAYLAQRRKRSKLARAGIRPMERNVDAAPARAHLKRLIAQGHKVVRIAAACGVTVDSISRIRRGQGSIRESTEARILAWKGDPELTVRVGKVPAAPAMWKLRALASTGHTCTAVARLAPIPDTETDPRAWVLRRADVLQRLRQGLTRELTPEVDANVTAGYEALWDKAPTLNDHYARQQSSRARNIAATAMWPYPMDLDDDRLADPTYKPARSPRQWTGDAAA